MNKKNNDADKPILQFIDRDDVKGMINSANQKLLRRKTHFEIIAIYGIGGIGKTRLLKEIFLSDDRRPKPKPVYITLEITSGDDLLDILLKFRKALPPKQYPLFDCVMPYVWNHLNTAKLNDELMQSIKKSSANIIHDALGVTLETLTGINVGEIINIFRKSVDRLVAYYNNSDIGDVIPRLGDMNKQELLQELPILLGKDIHRQFLEDDFVLVIDSYKEYSDKYSFSGWLPTLINQIRYGVYVVTSREKLDWPQELLQNVHSFNLEKLPETEVEKTLQSQFGFKPELIENIIRVTDCMPIYLDLAVRAVPEAPCATVKKEDIFFQDKDDIIKKFLLHLDADEREVITVLAVVQIFDQDIFEHLVKDLNLKIPVFKFDDVCQQTLIRSLEQDDSFYKTHDVISENIRCTTKGPVIKRIVHSYLEYICKRTLHQRHNIQISMLFKHVISIYIQADLTASKEETEQLLDFYFEIKESLLDFGCDEIDGFADSNKLKNLYYFMCAMSKERADSIKRLEWLNQIDETTCSFGKHLLSLKLMKGYLLGLCKGCQHMKSAVEEINGKLTKEDVEEWYYGQTKIFLGDCMISYGRYKTGIEELKKYRELIPQLTGKANDAFQVSRHIGHAYRFNMMLDEAASEYNALISDKSSYPTPLQRVYILTNLCETYCYFKPEKVFEISGEALRLSDKFKDLKSRGKICYSLAIACLHKKEYARAKEYIDESLSLNQRDGYIAGKLYAYMAQSYLDYARERRVKPETAEEIKRIIQQIEVYSCFELPIALMQEDYSHFNEIRASQEWLDFDKTAVNYRNFLSSLI